MSSKCIDLLYVIKSTIVNDCFVICVGLSLLSKTVDMTESIKGKSSSVLGSLTCESIFNSVVVVSSMSEESSLCVTKYWEGKFTSSGIKCSLVPVESLKPDSTSGT